MGNESYSESTQTQEIQQQKQRNNMSLRSQPTTSTTIIILLLLIFSTNILVVVECVPACPLTCMVDSDCGGSCHGMCRNNQCVCASGYWGHYPTCCNSCSTNIGCANMCTRMRGVCDYKENKCRCVDPSYEVPPYCRRIKKSITSLNSLKLLFRGW